MTIGTANYLTNSDWCIENNLTKAIYTDTDNIEVNVMIESIIVPIVGSSGIAGCPFHLFTSQSTILIYRESRQHSGIM